MVTITRGDQPAGLAERVVARLAPDGTLPRLVPLGTGADSPRGAEVIEVPAFLRRQDGGKRYRSSPSPGTLPPAPISTGAPDAEIDRPLNSSEPDDTHRFVASGPSISAGIGGATPRLLDTAASDPNDSPSDDDNRLDGDADVTRKPTPRTRMLGLGIFRRRFTKGGLPPVEDLDETITGPPVPEIPAPAARTQPDPSRAAATLPPSTPADIEGFLAILRAAEPAKQKYRSLYDAFALDPTFAANTNILTKKPYQRLLMTAATHMNVIEATPDLAVFSSRSGKITAKTDEIAFQYAPNSSEFNYQDAYNMLMLARLKGTLGPNNTIHVEAANDNEKLLIQAAARQMSLESPNEPPITVENPVQVRRWGFLRDAKLPRITEFANIAVEPVFVQVQPAALSTTGTASAAPPEAPDADVPQPADRRPVLTAADRAAWEAHLADNLQDHIRGEMTIVPVMPNSDYVHVDGHGMTATFSMEGGVARLKTMTDGGVELSLEEPSAKTATPVEAAPASANPGNTGTTLGVRGQLTIDNIQLGYNHAVQHRRTHPDLLNDFEVRVGAELMVRTEDGGLRKAEDSEKGQAILWGFTEVEGLEDGVIPVFPVPHPYAKTNLKAAFTEAMHGLYTKDGLDISNVFQIRKTALAQRGQDGFYTILQPGMYN